jgi:hypothetical protein
VGRNGGRTRLSFQFRLQKWSEVLDWFAEQAGLSLVMDAPPTGSFNYTDSRQYTPTEAIDLLNSVLLSKGYTLIRRDKMLIVLDLTEGIPEGLVPRVLPAELEKRGRFEFVSVLLPLEGRTPDDVLSEVTPLLGPHGTAVALRKTGQILVTDTAGVVRAVRGIIESIPKPSRPPERPAEPGPELRVYALDGLESGPLVEMLQTLVGGAKLVVDTQAEQLNAYARPKEHSAIESILNRMKTGDPVERRPRLEIYDVADTDTGRLVANLQIVAPQMQFNLDSTGGRLVAWGTPSEHATIKEVLQQLPPLRASLLRNPVPPLRGKRLNWWPSLRSSGRRHAGHQHALARRSSGSDRVRVWSRATADPGHGKRS